MILAGAPVGDDWRGFGGAWFGNLFGNEFVKPFRKARGDDPYVILR